MSDDQSSIPDWCFTADHPDWDSRFSLIESYPGYYELINDNLLDLTHLEFVHPETIGHKMKNWKLRVYEFAVYNTIGVRIRELPVTPEKVLTALGKL